MKTLLVVGVLLGVLLTGISYAETITQAGVSLGAKETRVAVDAMGLKATGKLLKLVVADSGDSSGVVVFADGILFSASNIGAFVWKLGETHTIRARIKGDMYELERVEYVQ